MPVPDPRPLPPDSSARARVEARRAARRRPRRPLLLGLGVAGVLVLLLVGLVLGRARQTLDTIQQQDPRPVANAAQLEGVPVASPAPPLDALRDPVNILLIGVDKRQDAEEDGARSDTLILVRLDPQAGWAGMLSLPRDSVVQVPRLGQAKINAAYTHGYAHAAELYGPGTEPDAGGGALAAETVERWLGLRVDYIAQVDFQGFQQLVDAVGGLLIDVPAPLIDAEFPTDVGGGVERIYIPAGLQVMDGRTALVYARSRHSSSDFDRSRRQQQVLHALLAQVRARGLLKNAALLPQWADLLAQNLRTTMPVRDLGLLNGLASFAAGLERDRIIQMSVNPDDVAIDAEQGSDIFWNAADVRALVARWLAGPAQPPQPVAGEQARVQVLNGAFADGVASRVSGYLEGRGFAMADAGNAPSRYEHTTIIDYSGRPATVRQLAAALGVAPQHIQSPPAADAPQQGPQVDIVVVVGLDYKPEWASN